MYVYGVAFLDSSNSSISSFITNRIAANAQTGRNWNDVKPPWFCSSPVMTASNSPLRRKNWPQILKPAEMIPASPSWLPRERDGDREGHTQRGTEGWGFTNARVWGFRVLAKSRTETLKPSRHFCEQGSSADCCCSDLLRSVLVLQFHASQRTSYCRG